MKKILLAGSVALATLLSCSKDNDDNDANSADQAFVNQVAVGNKAEIMAGQLAATKGSAAVQTFGQLMVTEHGQAQSDLQNVASGIGVTLPDTVDAEHQALMARLDTLSGLAFDTVYINSQLRDHQKTVNIFQTEISNGNNSTVRNYANTYLPRIQMHLQMADSLSKTF